MHTTQNRLRSTLDCYHQKSRSLPTGSPMLATLYFRPSLKIQLLLDWMVLGLHSFGFQGPLAPRSFDAFAS